MVRTSIFRRLAAAFLLVFAAPFFAQVSPAEDTDLWTRLDIQEAFVSRRTTIDFRDAFGSPEFGWKIASEGRILARGELYSTLYYPLAPPDSAVLLVGEQPFMEIDGPRNDLRLQPQRGPARAVVIAETIGEGAGLIRIRASIGGGRQEYHAVVVAGADRKPRLLQIALRNLRSRQSWQTPPKPDYLGDRFGRWAPVESKAYCSRAPTSATQAERDFCAAVFRQSGVEQ